MCAHSTLYTIGGFLLQCTGATLTVILELYTEYVAGIPMADLRVLIAATSPLFRLMPR